MAIRMIPAIPGSSGRNRKTSVKREVITQNHGPIRKYGPCPLAVPVGKIRTGGSNMTSLLGPDLGDGQRRGTPTNSSSLQPVMGLLNANSQKGWKAGHLLNAELGGSGKMDANLIPLTTAANSAHRIFEDHIRRMLLLCNQIDRNNPSHDVWYGVKYSVAVSPTQYSYAPAVGDMYSYAYSHITLNYSFVKLPKFPAAPPPHTSPSPPNTSSTVSLAGPADPKLVDLQCVGRPNFTPSNNIANWVVGAGGIQFGVEIHNES